MVEILGLVKFLGLVFVKLWETVPSTCYGIDLVWAKLMWMGEIVLLLLKIEVRLIIFFSLD